MSSSSPESSPSSLLGSSPANFSRDLPIVSGIKNEHSNPKKAKPARLSPDLDQRHHYNQWQPRYTYIWMTCGSHGEASVFPFSKPMFRRRPVSD